MREYLGEEEESIINLIISQIKNKSSANSILDTLYNILDDDAEVLIYTHTHTYIYIYI